MAFKALVQDGTVYLVPAALDVPPERRDQLRPIVFAPTWDKVPVNLVPVGSCGPLPPEGGPQVLPPIEVTAEAPAPVEVAHEAAHAAEVPRSERRKGDRR